MPTLRPATTSLLVVDAQQGFTDLCPGELPVPGGAAIVPHVNDLLALRFARIDASQDWHPPDHRSFHGRADGLYPPHCVAGTPGAEFLPGLHAHRFGTVWRKGFDPDFEAYAITAQHPGFPALLRASGVTAVVVCGLAANICVFHSARDLKAAGFDVWIATDASAGLDVPSAGLYEADAVAECAALGIRRATVAEVGEAFL